MSKVGVPPVPSAALLRPQTLDPYITAWSQDSICPHPLFFLVSSMFSMSLLVNL